MFGVGIEMKFPGQWSRTEGQGKSLALMSINFDR